MRLKVKKEMEWTDTKKVGSLPIFSCKKNPPLPFWQEDFFNYYYNEMGGFEPPNA